jgi:hypothetical protein
VPAEEFLETLPPKVAARFDVVLDTVRSAPPPQFSGGGFWEAMHGSMNGYYEVRITGPGRVQHRLFCILDNADQKAARTARLRQSSDRGDQRPEQEVRREVQRRGVQAGRARPRRRLPGELPEAGDRVDHGCRFRWGHFGQSLLSNRGKWLPARHRSISPRAALEFGPLLAAGGAFETTIETTARDASGTRSRKRAKCSDFEMGAAGFEPATSRV